MEIKGIPLEKFKESFLSIKDENDLKVFLAKNGDLLLDSKVLNYFKKNQVVFNWPEEFTRLIRNAGLAKNIDLKKHELLTQLNVAHAQEKDYSKLILHAVRDFGEKTFEYLKQQKPEILVKIFMENPEVSRLVSLYTYLDLCVEKAEKGPQEKLEKKIAYQREVLSWFASHGFLYEPSFIEFDKSGISNRKKAYGKIPSLHVTELRESLNLLYLKNQIIPAPSKKPNPLKMNRF